MGSAHCFLYFGLGTAIPYNTTMYFILFSQATEVLVREYGLTGMVLELVREISRIDSTELARDTSGTRLGGKYSPKELARDTSGTRLGGKYSPVLNLTTKYVHGYWVWCVEQLNEEIVLFLHF